MFDVKGKSMSDGTERHVYKIRDGLDGNVEFLFYKAESWTWEAANGYEPVEHKLTWEKWPKQ
jgi:hypothetical protein